MNHYPKHIGDYLKKTIGLSMVQDGAYNRAIDLYYGTEKPLALKPAVYDDLRCRDRRDREAVDFILTRFFTETPAGFVHERCEEEIAAYRGKAAKAAASASIGWAKRNANATRTHSGPDANAERTHSDGNASQNQNQNQGVKPELGTGTDGQVRKKPMGDNSPEKPKPQANGQGWWKTESGITAHGKAIGIPPKRGESTADYKARLFSVSHQRRPKP